MRFPAEAWPFVIPWWVLSAGAWILGHPLPAALLALFGVAILLFFRDPSRRFEGPASELVAPADGKVLTVETVASDLLDGTHLTRVVTFLSAFDVHVQRCPATGEVVGTEYVAGRKVAAFRADAGRLNERRLTLIRTARGDTIGVQQIAGLMARRVVGYLETGDRVERGQQLGLIKFGSRVDLLVPAGFRIVVGPGVRVRAGETVMATTNDD